MSHLLHVFPLISLHEHTPITDAYQWNAHDHFKQTIYNPAHFTCFKAKQKCFMSNLTA